MAELNLVPNPLVLAVQAGVFLANVLVVKSLYITPYLSVRDRRDKLTVGNKDDAVRAVQQADQIASDVNAKLAHAATEAKAAKDVIRDKALAERNKLLAAAETEAKALVAQVEGEIKASLAAERAKVPAIVQQLTQEVYQRALA